MFKTAEDEDALRAEKIRDEKYPWRIWLVDDERHIRARRVDLKDGWIVIYGWEGKSENRHFVYPACRVWQLENFDPQAD